MIHDAIVAGLSAVICCLIGSLFSHFVEKRRLKRCEENSTSVMRFLYKGRYYNTCKYVKDKAQSLNSRFLKDETIDGIISNLEKKVAKGKEPGYYYALINSYKLLANMRNGSHAEVNQFLETNASQIDNTTLGECEEILSKSTEEKRKQEMDKHTEQEVVLWRTNRSHTKDNGSRWVKILATSLTAFALVAGLFFAGVMVYQRYSSWDVLTGFSSTYESISYYGIVAPQSSLTIEECIYLADNKYVHLIGNYVSQGGVYQIIDNNLTLKEYDGTIHDYTIFPGKYIVGATCKPKNKLPKKKRFNASVIDNNGHSAIFFSDGSALYDDKKAIYERDGYTIYITLLDEKCTLTNYVIDGFLCSDTYLADNVNGYTRELAEYAKTLYYLNYEAGKIAQQYYEDKIVKKFEKKYPIEVDKIIFKTY